MNAEPFTHGVIVRGGPSSGRKVCTWRKAFETYLAGDAATDGEAYLSMFTYPGDFLQHVKQNGFAGYRGPVFAEYICLDFDNEADPAAAIGNAQKLLRWLEYKAAADLARVIACFSGGKGAHLYFPTSGILAEPAVLFPKICKAFALLLARDARLECLDSGIYDAARIFRLPNTRHGKTGLLKLPFSGADFANLDPAAIVELARREPRDALPVADGAAWCDWTLQGYWNRATDYITKQASAAPAASQKQDLNRATLEFIQEGAHNGERHNRLFQAAANLAEFGADERLARALLMEAARDSGLPLPEVESTIQAGIRHAKGAA